MRFGQKRGTALLACIAALVMIAAGGAAVSAQPAQTIRVVGEASMSVDADIAVLVLGVLQQGKTPTLAQQAVSMASDRILASITALGIDRKKMRTGNFSMYAVYDDKPGKQNEIIGYRAETSITVTIEDLKQVALVMERALFAGANQIQNLQFQKKNEEALRLQLLKEAAENAARKAQAIANGLGLSILKPVSVEEQSYSMRAPNRDMYMTKAAAGSGQDPFAAGSIELTASVSALFEVAADKP